MWEGGMEAKMRAIQIYDKELPVLMENTGSRARKFRELSKPYEEAVRAQMQRK